MKFLGLCICEKVIVDKQGVHTLVNLMFNAEIQRPPDQQIPPNAVAPNQWFIYTMWTPSTEDVGRKFEQVFKIYWPDGEEFSEQRLEFTQPDSSVQQVTLSIFGFPIGQAGKLRIVTWLDHAGHRLSELVETGINVKHSLQANSRSSAPAPAKA